MHAQTIKSPGGITAWLVEDYAVPMFAVRFAFEGGSFQDPQGKEGLANFVTLMLQQGAGDMTVEEFQRRVEDLAIRVNFTLGFDAIYGGIEALSETWRDVAELLRTVLVQPRFEEDAVERVRGRLVGYAGGEARRPGVVADVEWDAAAFADSPYTHRVAGDETSIERITADDLKAYRRRVFARDNLKVAVVGDISIDELGRFLDLAFGDLPERAELAELPTMTPVTGGRLRVAEVELPQSVIAFGGGSVRYDSPDFVAAELLIHIVGGGTNSRLFTELRQKRGLAHVARTWLERWPDGAILRGRITTRNEAAGEVLDILRDQLQRMAHGDLGQAELDEAKAYLVGSDPVGCRSHAKVSELLLYYAQCGFGPDYHATKETMIASVTLDDLKRVAAPMLDPENLIVSIAGTPALQPRPSDGQ